MSLYIRLYTDFWSHRKTVKLKMIIGSDAYWVPPRLWSYAAENQMDGDFSDYSSEMICDILGCSKHAPSMLQALHEAGFMENGKLNDWEQHNHFHAVNSDRARKAAKAKHEKERNKKEPKNKERNTETETEQAGLKHAPSRNEPKTNTYSEAFLKAWIAYPNKNGKSEAYKAWDKLKPDEDLQSMILKAISIQKTWPAWTKDQGKFIPHFSTWMNQMRWEDEGLEKISSKTLRPSYELPNGNQ